MIIPLSPIDYYFFRPRLYTIQFIFEYAGQMDEVRFRSAVELSVVQMPIAGARIRIISDKEIGLEPGQAIDVRFQSLTTEPDFSKEHEAESLVSGVENVEDVALIKILVTKTGSRSYVGFSFSHLLGDGASFFMFLEGLSRILTGGIGLPRVSNERTLWSATSAVGSGDFFKDTGYVAPRAPAPTHVDIQRIFYADSELDEMKRECSVPGFRASANVCVMADLAARFHTHIPRHQGKFIVRCPVDYRSIYNLPQNYFGNAVRDAVAVFEGEEMASMTRSQIARRVHDAIAGIDAASVGRSLAALEEYRLANGAAAFANLSCPGLLVSNLSKFPMQKMDFGAGPPRAFHHVSLNPRLALILPAERGVTAVFKRPADSIYA